MDTPLAFPHLNRWAVLVATGATVAALGCLPATQAGTVTARQPDSGSAAGWSGGIWGDLLADTVAKDAYGQNAAQQDAGSLFTVEKAIGVRGVWGKKDSHGRNVTGQGVGVALLDSGISPVPGLDSPSKVSYGPDLSVEGNGVLADTDTFGHGTFMAGIIAGRTTSNPSNDLPSAPANVQLGVAPDAKLLAVKLATTDGSTDVSQVIAGLDWVVQHPVLPDGTRIRVINLSYGTDSSQAYQLDPLAAAAENAWRHGIVVVTSAGNAGTATGRLTDPATDPYLLAVGAADSQARTDGWAHDHTRPAAFSNVSTGRHADLLAPGTSVVSARDPGSYIDTNHPEGRVAGDYSGRLFRGSGTSQAAAVVTGVVADLLQAFPALTPDQVKYALVSSAQQINNGNAASAGAGIVAVAQAYDKASHLLGTDSTGAQLRAAAVQSFPQATGLGSIEEARGGAVMVDADGNDLTGEIDALGNPWNGAAWYQASSSLTAWSGGQWLGSTWTGDGWQLDLNLLGLSLTSARWSSARWSSARWSDADWSSARWSSARWSSARWSSARWSSARWSSEDW
ncbi:MAG: S8 family serine peptidase [Jatrophihabitantaceae bacterium]